MSNTILTIDMITRESLRILHQKLNFIGKLNLQYDSQFAVEGAKIGASLRVRTPAKYTVNSGPTLTTQDHTETKIDLPLATQKHVGVSFTTKDMTLSLDEFSNRILDPAVSVLASNVEADAMNLFDEATHGVLATTAVDFADVNSTREKLTYSLAPQDNLRCMTWNPAHVTDFLNDTKGLFQDSTQISTQYKEGELGRIAGFNHFENTINPAHTTGALAGTPLSNGTDQTGASIATDGWTASTTIKEGDIVTFSGSYAVHDETKSTLGFLKQFVVRADVTASTAGAATLTLSPAVSASGSGQNVSQAIADGATVTALGSASTVYQRSIGFHRDFAAFVTADLLMPQGVDMASRQVMDGISMRIVRDYNISTDQMPCRIDVLYGYAALYPELGCTVWL